MFIVMKLYPMFDYLLDCLCFQCFFSLCKHPLSKVPQDIQERSYLRVPFGIHRLSRWTEQLSNDLPI